MKVILLHNVKKIGKQGDIVDVADGYANGFLLPKRLAKVATNDAVRQLQNEKKQVMQSTEAEKRAQSKLFELVVNKEVTITAQANDKDHLFASITKKDIVMALQKDFGVLVDDTCIIHDGIKHIGSFDIPIAIGEDRGKILLHVHKK